MRGRRLPPTSAPLLLVVAVWTTPCVAQTLPTEPSAPRPGEGRSSLGPSPGAGSDPTSFAPAEAGPLSGRPGRVGPRLPAGVTRPEAGFAPTAPAGIIRPVPLPPSEAPAYGALDDSRGEGDEGPADGISLDAAIERLVIRNLTLRAQRYEIPQAQADILTAGLRANPLIYADATAIPYGNYSNARPGGQTQYDVSITYPLDVTHKRRARTAVACKAKKVLEAQFQDAVRLQIDNLYTAFVDVLAARETLRFSEANLAGLGEVLRQVEFQRKVGNLTDADLNAIRVQYEAGELGVRDARAGLDKAKEAMAVLLDIPPSQSTSFEVRGSVRVLQPDPPPDEQLLSTAYNLRPDLVAYRLGVGRAEADVDLAMANRYSDVYLLYGPYVFQNNAPFHKKSAHSWSVAVTAPLPLYNRNQGNIERARLNVSQTKVGLAALERQVIGEVRRADREYDVTRAAVEQLERALLPRARQILANAQARYKGGEDSPLAVLEARRGYNEVVRQYRDNLVRHRRSMLALNTAVGWRILP